MLVPISLASIRSASRITEKCACMVGCDTGKCPSGVRALAQQLQHLASGGVGQCFEDRVHCRYLAKYPNACRAPSMRMCREPSESAICRTHAPRKLNASQQSVKKQDRTVRYRGSGDGLRGRFGPATSVPSCGRRRPGSRPGGTRKPHGTDLDCVQFLLLTGGRGGIAYSKPPCQPPPNRPSPVMPTRYRSGTCPFRSVPSRISDVLKIA